MAYTYIPGTYTIPELRIGELVILNRQFSVLSNKPFPRDKIIVGFMGSSGKETDGKGNTFTPTDEDKGLGNLIGRIIADNEVVLSNGAVWGLPYFPIRAANRLGVYTFGISPYPDKESHQEKNPTKHFDMIFYAGINCTVNPRADFTFRDWINTLYTDIVISAGGRIGTPDECLHVLEQGGIYIPIRGTGGATDLLIEGIERGVFGKDTGAKIIIADKTQKSLESAINEGIAEARSRWSHQGITQNLFSDVIGELEEVMLVNAPIAEPLHSR